MKFADGLFLSDFARASRKGREGRTSHSTRYSSTRSDMKLVRRPYEFDVLVLHNLYGDIVRDLTAGLVGGLGSRRAPTTASTRRSSRPRTCSAPKYTGQNKVNPTAMILSGKLMLEHLGERHAARRLEAAVAAVIAAGHCVTYDRKPTRDDLDRRRHLRVRGRDHQAGT